MVARCRDRPRPRRPLPRALVRSLHDSGATASDDRQTGASELAAEALSSGVHRVTASCTGGSEDTDRRAELGECPEAVNEFRLDPQHPPWIGVDPVSGAATFQQPLVGRRVRCGPLTAYDRALPVPVFGLLHDATLSPPTTQLSQRTRASRQATTS